MPMLLMIVGLYLAIGLVVGLAFAWRGASRVDKAAAGSPWVFRVVIYPGCVGLWPVVLWQWIKATKGPVA